LVVVVGSADPIGMQRLVRGLAELRDAEVAAPAWVVLNRVREGAVPGEVRAEVTAALGRFAGRWPAALLPADPRSVDAAPAGGRRRLRPPCTAAGGADPARPARPAEGADGAGVHRQPALGR